MIKHPEALWLLIFLLPLAILLVVRSLKGMKSAVRLAGPWREERIKEVYAVKSFLMNTAVILFLLCGILALSGITVEGAAEYEDVQGNDVIFLVDLSYSMLAQDITPSRLARAGSLISAVAEGLPGARIGVVAFKGSAHTIMPVTEDRNILSRLIPGLSPDLITTPGTNLAQGISTGAGSFPSTAERKRVLILISDGDTLTGDDPVAAATDAFLQGVEIISVGAGTYNGAKIPLGGGRFVTDQQGREVTARLRSEILRQIAEAAQGDYYAIDIPGLSTKILEHFWQPGSDGGQIRGSEETVYLPFLVIMTICMIVIILARSIRWKGML